MTGAFKNQFDFLAKEPMRGDAVGLAALAGGQMAVNSNDVKEGLDDAASGRLQGMVESVVEMGRRLIGT